MANVIASIEIEQYDDGTFMVSRESAQQEAAEGGAEVPETGEQSAKNIDDALRIARGMVSAPAAPAAIPAKPAVQPALGVSLKSKPNALTMR